MLKKTGLAILLVATFTLHALTAPHTIGGLQIIPVNNDVPNTFTPSQKGSYMFELLNSNDTPYWYQIQPITLIPSTVYYQTSPVRGCEVGQAFLGVNDFCYFYINVSAPPVSQPYHTWGIFLLKTTANPAGDYFTASFEVDASKKLAQ